MECPKCGSNNVNVSVINETHLVKEEKKKHGVIWWVCIGWWWIPVWWLCFTLPALIISLFKKNKKKVVNVQQTICVCQNCANKWNV